MHLSQVRDILLCLLVGAAPAFAVAFHHHGQCVNGSQRCMACNGTDFRLGFQRRGGGVFLLCPACRGAGFYGSYCAGERLRGE